MGTGAEVAAHPSPVVVYQPQQVETSYSRLKFQAKVSQSAEQGRRCIAGA